MKTRLLAVLLVSALVLASTGPVALAQKAGKAGRDNGNASITIVDCSQVQQIFASQGQYGDADAVAVDGSVAVAQISQRLDISQSQVNVCLGNIGGGGEETTEESTEETTEESTEETTEASTEKTGDGEETMVKDGKTIIMPDELSDTKLPDTGGASGFALAAGCALLGVGLIVNRIVR